MLPEEDDLNQNKLLSSIGKKYLNCIYFSDPGPQNWRFFLSLEDNKEDIWNKPTLNRKLSFKMFTVKTDLY